MHKGVIGRSLEDSDAIEFIRRSNEETRAQREKRIKKVCMKCQHYSGSYYKGDGHCNYILDTGRSRPCSYVDCVEAGVFLPKSRKKGWTAKGGRFLGP